MAYEQELALLKGVPVAKDLNGHVCRIPIESNHWFVAARTGGGKGSWIWSLVLGLVLAWLAGLVKFYGIDPKLIELSMGRDFFEQYADDDQSCVELLEKAVDEMHARGRAMQGVSRKFTPSLETPLIVVVIDEMGYLLAQLPDKRLRERANTAIAALLNKGRAPGFAVVGCVQDPRKETCNQRDGFTIRIAGGMPAPMVDLVLGEGMYALGARCDMIPPGQAGAGVAYVLDEVSLKPRLVRAPWCSDETIQRVLQNVPRQALNASRDVKDERDELQWELDTQPLQQW
jgi:S-DNA-T family DNA segregation ATPase FtsK/SpoIIIE